MICKEEISSWFKDSTGAKRIEVLCSLLRMCLPMELRFIGTCLEDLARKDFIFLREAEIRANDADNMERLTADFFDEATRGKISVYLSLLYSTNNRGSEAMFKMLCCLLPSLRSHTNGWCNTGPAGAELIDSTYAEDVILLLTMSANHPAFTFNQRQHLYSDLQSVEELLQVFSWKVGPSPSPSWVRLRLQDDLPQKSTTYHNLPPEGTDCAGWNTLVSYAIQWVHADFYVFWDPS